MAIRLDQFSAQVPSGAVIGVIGENGSGQSELLDAVARAGRSIRRLGPVDPLEFPMVEALLVEHTLSYCDAVARAHAAVEIDRLRRRGTSVLLVSHDADLLRTLCDEVWWMRDHRIAARGDPGEVLAQYRRHVAGRLREAANGRMLELTPSFRRGDGRAHLEAIEVQDGERRLCAALHAGESARIVVTVRFDQAVDDPVVGIMIRTRIGFEVYGTNTGLENVRLGPVAAGQRLRVVFSFRCDLCPNQYTVTAASHDRDGASHDWIDDAVAFMVLDSRETAGVANLRARVEIEPA